jgi:ATP-dependent helicase/DNAse subunit B
MPSPVADGAPGGDGEPGADRVDGAPGVDGVPGADRVDGVDGVDGEPGADRGPGGSPAAERATEPATPALELEPGLRLRGRIDRVDLDPDRREAIVYDYKGREATPGRGWEDKGRLQIPLYMRAVRDLLGLDSVGGFYLPLSARDQRPRGALLAEADPDLDCLSNDRFTREELDELIASASRRAAQAAGEIRAGRLVSRPQTCAPGGGCAYPGICRCED